ncbi:MAG: hypothetical protein PHF63_11970 [Herbinix sp.]|nr:hypothetical protein [Herbinix sp.]
MERGVKSIPVVFGAGNFFDFIVSLIIDLRVFFMVVSNQTRKAYYKSKIGSQLQVKILIKWERTLRAELKEIMVVHTKMPYLESTNVNKVCAELLEVISRMYIEELRLVKTAAQAHSLFYESPACTKARVVILKKWKRLFLEELKQVKTLQYIFEFSFEAPFDKDCMDQLNRLWSCLSNEMIAAANDRRELKVLKYYLADDESVQKNYADKKVQLSVR